MRGPQRGTNTLRRVVQRALFAVAVTALSASSASKQPLPYPDLFIIGAQKCGTTTLNLLLQRHPSFCDQGLKEKHFFSDDKAYVTNYDAHVAKFLGEFKKCNKSLLTIDATPSYVWLDYVPGFVKESYTKADLKAKKFVLLLREPVLRRYSEYQRELRLCLRIFDDSGYDFSQLYDYGRSNKYNVETMVEHSKKYCSRIMKNSAAEAISSSSSSGKGHKKDAVNFADAEFMTFAGWQESASGVNELSRGYYLEQMKRWLKVIDRSQLMVLSFTDLISKTTATVEALASFLGVDPARWYKDKNHTIVLPPPAAYNHYIDTDTWAPALLDCGTFKTLWKHYAKKNEGLFDFINDNPKKPPQEPPFPAWTYDETVSRCQNLTVDGQPVEVMPHSAPYVNSRGEKISAIVEAGRRRRRQR